jgi:hypothetical protein
MHGMKTPTAPPAPAPDGPQPFGSLEAAARWNAMAFEWMTRGWQQWLELVTVWPALDAPAQGQTATAAATRTQEEHRPRAVAKPAAKRPATRRPSRPQAAARTRTRTRG